MIRVLLDACVPRRLRADLSDFTVETAHAAGLDEIGDGALLDEIEGRYDILVTRDQNLELQQRIVGRSVAVVVLRTIDQSPEAFRALVPRLRLAIVAAAPGTVTIVEADT